MSGQNFYNPVEHGFGVNSRVVPLYNINEPRQIYATLEDFYLHGGFRVCDTIQGALPFPADDNTGIDVPIPNYRNYITFDRRKIGMLVYTLDDGKFWQLIKNPSASFPPNYDYTDRTLTTNSDWLELNFNQSVFSVITYNNTTGILKIIFNRNFTSGATYEHSGTTYTQILS